MIDLEYAKSILKNLVGFDTTSCNSNSDLVHYIAEYFSSYGINSEIIWNSTKTKANLIARIGSAETAGIVLSGHTDVVPATEGNWFSPPFELSEREGRLFGRGTCDMKGFLACVLAATPAMAAAPLTRPIYLCFSYDEELGCLGVPSIAEYFEQLPVRPILAIIGEPSGMKYITSHKGKIAMRCKVHGTSGHSSMAPKHVNAIKYSAQIISLIDELAEGFKLNGPFDSDYSIPYSTMLTTMFHSGVATNITPEISAFTFEIRSLPAVDPHVIIEKLKTKVAEEIVPAMKAINSKADIEWEEIFSYPAMGDASASQGFGLLQNILPEWGGKVSYGSEGGVFEIAARIPALILGPGSIVQAHKANEYIEIDQLNQCISFLEQLIDSLGGEQAGCDD